MNEELAFKYLGQVNVGLNVTAMVCALVVVLIVATTMYINPKLMDRLSIRFTLAISIIDFIKAGVILIYIFTTSDGTVCTFLSFSIHWLSLIYLFLNVAIAANLHMVFVLGKTFKPVWELYYWVISFSSATFLMLLPLMAGKLGLDKQSGACEFRNRDLLSTQIWIWSSYLVWILISSIYCFLIVILSVIKLRQKVSVLNKLKATEAKLMISSDYELDPEALQNNLRKLIRRVALYCIIPFVTQIGFLMNSVYEYSSGEPSVVLLYASVIGTDLPGILNLIAFLLDPAFKNTLNYYRQSKSADLGDYEFIRGRNKSNFPQKTSHSPFSQNNISIESAHTNPPRKVSKSVYMKTFRRIYDNKTLPPVPTTQDDIESQLLNNDSEYQTAHDFIKGV